MFPFKLLLAKVPFPFKEVHACKLCRLPLVGVQSGGVLHAWFCFWEFSMRMCLCVFVSRGGGMSSLEYTLHPL